MYLAKTLSSSETQASFYKDILSNLIKNPKDISKHNIDNAILEAKEVAMDEKHIYSINHKYYFFVTTLLNNYSEGLKKIKSEKIENKIYSDILSIL